MPVLVRYCPQAFAAALLLLAIDLSFSSWQPDTDFITTVRRLSIHVTISADADPTATEAYEYDVKVDPHQELDGPPRVLPREGGASYDKISATLNGQTVKVVSVPYGSSTALVTQDTKQKAEHTSNTYVLRYTIHGLIKKSGYERALLLPIAGKGFLAPIERVSASASFGFPASPEFSDLPDVHVNYRGRDGKITASASAPWLDGAYTIDMAHVITVNEAPVLSITWRPPSASSTQ